MRFRGESHESRTEMSSSLSQIHAARAFAGIGVEVGADGDCQGVCGDEFIP
jgi:hypothetical protein